MTRTTMPTHRFRIYLYLQHIIIYWDWFIILKVVEGRGDRSSTEEQGSSRKIRLGSDNSTVVRRGVLVTDVLSCIYSSTTLPHFFVLSKFNIDEQPREGAQTRLFHVLVHHPKHNISRKYNAPVTCVLVRSDPLLGSSCRRSNEDGPSNPVTFCISARKQMCATAVDPHAVKEMEARGCD